MFEWSWSLVTFSIVVFVAGVAVGIRIHQWWTWVERNTLEWYEERIRDAWGWTTYHGIGHYHLMSFDGGRNWYPVSKEGDEVRVLFPDPRYNGLVEHHRALENLYKLVQRGTSVPWDEFDDRAWALLAEAGFYYVPEAAKSPIFEMWDALIGIMNEFPITASPGIFRRAEELLSRSGFVLLDRKLAEKALHRYVEDHRNWTPTPSVGVETV